MTPFHDRMSAPTAPREALIIDNIDRWYSRHGLRAPHDIGGPFEKGVLR